MTRWTKTEILEYPYYGTITHIVKGQGEEDDEQVVIYEGVMDEHMTSDEVGDALQTSGYTISIPLTKNDSGEYILPLKGDVISINTYGLEFELTIDNVEPSQLGGVSITASRKSW